MRASFLLLCFLTCGCGVRIHEELAPISEISAEFEKEFGKEVLLYPCGIDLDFHGYIYVLDCEANKVLEYKDSEFVLEFGHFGTTEGRFCSPSGIEVFENYFYVADFGNHRVQKFDLQGNFLSEFEYEKPCDIAVDMSGCIYVCESENNRITKLSFDPEPEVLSSFGKFGWGEGFLNNPVAVAIDKENGVYVSDRGNSRIEKFSSSGTFLQTIGEKTLKNPERLAIDRQGNIFVCDGEKIVVFDKKGRKVSEIAEKLKAPKDVTLGFSRSGEAKLYVADAEDKVIKVFRLGYR